jgi:hypothetical protein
LSRNLPSPGSISLSLPVETNMVALSSPIQ